MSYGIVTHFLPVPVHAGQPVRDRGIDVWVALEALELALLGRFDVVVLVTGNRDYVPQVRKLNALDVRVMLLGWNITYETNQGQTRVIRAAGVLAREVTHHVRMEEVIGSGVGEEHAAADPLFVQRRDRFAGNGHAPVAGDPVIYVVSRNDRGPIARRVELLEDVEQGESPGTAAGPTIKAD